MRNQCHAHFLSDLDLQTLTKPQWSIIFGSYGIIKDFAESFSGPNCIESFLCLFSCNPDETCNSYAIVYLVCFFIMAALPQALKVFANCDKETA